MGNSLYPDTINGKIQYFAGKVAPWTAAATSIGTTTTQVAAMGTKAATAQTKLANALAAREVAKNATAELDAAVRDLVNAGGDIVRQIRAKAATDGNNVYFLAQIPAPAAPTPVPAPGTPTDFKVTLNPDGSLRLRWKCQNPAGSVGTIYQVARRLGAAGPFVPLTGVGKRSFTDPTVPAGTASVTYRITAVRSTAAGESAEFLVNFGTGSSGEFAVASVAVSPKLAA